jgi:hypothetical protein
LTNGEGLLADIPADVIVNGGGGGGDGGYM